MVALRHTQHTASLDWHDDDDDDDDAYLRPDLELCEQSDPEIAGGKLALDFDVLGIRKARLHRVVLYISFGRSPTRTVTHRLRVTAQKN